MRKENVSIKTVINILFENKKHIKDGYFRCNIESGSLYIEISQNSISWILVSLESQILLEEEIIKFSHKIGQYLFQEGKQIDFLESKSVNFETNSEKFLLMFVNNEFFAHIKDSDFEIKFELEGMKNAISNQLRLIKEGSITNESD